jgi:hypothetical protein
MQDPVLSALVTWLVLPGGLAVCGLCLALWRARRGWVVTEGVVRIPPDPRDPGALTGIEFPGPDGAPRTLRLHLPAARRNVREGQVVTLSHPPGQPEAAVPGTPMPLLAGAVAGGLMAMLGLSILLGF